MPEPPKKTEGSSKQTTYTYPNGAKVKGSSFTFRTNAS